MLTVFHRLKSRWNTVSFCFLKSLDAQASYNMIIKRCKIKEIFCHYINKVYNYKGVAVILAEQAEPGGTYDALSNCTEKA